MHTLELPPRFAAALRRARYEQFSEEAGTAARAAKLFRRLRATPTFRAHVKARQSAREELAAARLSRLFS